MELQVVLIGAAVVIISAIIYFISIFTMKEKTFEEVIAEQKRKNEEEENKVKSEKKAEKDTRRRFKKGKDKIKDQSSKSKVADDAEHKMVNIELEPEIFEPVAPETPLKINKKKEKTSKSILLNKGEKTPIVPEEYVEEFVHRIPTPKDDLELKHIHEAKKDKPSKETKDKNKKHSADSREPEEVVEEITIKKEKPVQLAALPSESENQITFKKDSGIAKLIATVTTETLSDADIQSLIDVLHEKQGSTDWNKKSQKGDPVVLLRKQLEEKERSLHEEQQMLLSANTELKEIRQKLNQKKLKYLAMEKNFKEKYDYQASEAQALHSRYQHTLDQNTVEITQLRTNLQKLEEQADQASLQRLVDENSMLKESLNKAKTESISLADANTLKQKVSIMENELSSNALKLNASENTKKTLEQKLAQIETELKKKYETQQASIENQMEKRVEEISQELRKAEAKGASLSEDLQTKEKAVSTFRTECTSLKSQLLDLENSLKDNGKSTQDMEEKLKKADREKADIQENLKNLQDKIDNFEKEKAIMLTEIKGLKQDNSNLNTELQMTKEQLQAAPAIQSKQPNGDVSAADMTDSVSMAEHEKQLHMKEAEIGNLTKELEVKHSELTSLAQQLEVKKSELASLTEQLAVRQSAVESLRQQLEVKQSTLASSTEQLEVEQSTLVSLTKQLEVKQSNVESLTQQLEAQKIKNNKLRERNWKAMDALEKSEKLISEKVKKCAIKGKWEELSVSLKELEMFDKSVMQRLFPDVSVKEKKSHKDWMSDFESEVSRQLTSLYEKFGNAVENEKQENMIHELVSKTQQLEAQLKEVEKSRTSLQSLLDEAETSCSKLQTQISKYRDVLSETEIKLTHLESSVVAEEKNWQEKLQAKELELQQAKEDVTAVKQEMVKSLESQEMKKKVEELETNLQSSEGRCAELETLVKQAETQVTECNIQIIELQKSSTDVSKLNADLKELQKKNKSFASQMIKLNGIIKTGHDALTQEQNLVKKLQDQLGTNLQNSIGVTNGTSEIDKASSQSSLTKAGNSL